MVARRNVPWLACSVILLACGRDAEHADHSAPPVVRRSGAPKLTPMPLRPLAEDLLPCAQCHAQSAEQAAEEGLLEPNLERREVTDPHDVIRFTHDAEHRWCLDCHDVWKRDNLRLANGTLLELRESVSLCAQCHGPQHRDWKVGAHGRRIGEWESSGAKQYFRCVNCHDPHSPQIPPIEPQPAPLPPRGRHEH